MHPSKFIQKKFVNLAIKLVKQGKVKEASRAIQPAITYFKRIKCNKFFKRLLYWTRKYITNES